MTTREFKQVLQYFCCRWSEAECKLVFDGEDFDHETYRYSLGDHLWKKWLYGLEYHNGPLDCITWYILEGMDDDCLQKILNRVEEIYGREKD